jgi:MATE family multidrug resistance protein
MGLGLPAATQVTLEVGAFTVATAFAARLDAVASAAHQIALNLAGLAYMIPLGLCSAAAVRVGHAVGAGDRQRAIDAGWLAVGLAAVLAVITASIMLAMPVQILSLFTRDANVVALGTSLLAIAAAFQLFDGVQTVAIGALRGLGDTVVPMIANLIVHWFLGLPLGYVLCFRLGMGVTGIWLGFSAGLIVASIVLLGVWLYRTRTLELGPLSEPSLQRP